VEPALSLSRTEIADIEKIIESSGLSEVRIEQNGESIVIGATKPAEMLKTEDLIAIAAPLAGTVSLDRANSGQQVAQGDVLARISVLGAETPIAAPQPGRIAAILVEDGGLVGYGAELILLDPGDTP
jgi:biotin carboxyl carrier protein